MINDVAKFFEKFAKGLGLMIRIPRPGKRMLNISVGINASVGIALIVSGIAFSKKILGLLGGIGLISAFLLAIEKESA